jgi:hypothetical protein
MATRNLQRHTKVKALMQEINELYGDLEISVRTTAEKAWTIGGKLHDLQKVVGFGNWGKVFEDPKFRISQRTAERWIKTYLNHPDGFDKESKVNVSKVYELMETSTEETQNRPETHKKARKESSLRGFKHARIGQYER